jgi:uncharacterized alkaline shock family protein YloU
VNAFNRIVVILALLGIMVVSAIFFIVPLPMLGTINPFLQGLETRLEAMVAPLRVLGGIVFTFLVWFFCAALLWLEVRRPRMKTIRVQKVSGGEAVLTADSIASRLEYNIDQLADVVRVKPVINTGRRGVRVDLELETSPEIDVPMKTEEVQQLTKDIVENRMGLKLDSVRVIMRHAPYPRTGARVLARSAGYREPEDSRPTPS